jgi:hypothetical protein
MAWRLHLVFVQLVIRSAFKMPVRTFRSPDGDLWSVWEVIPGRVSDFRSSHGSHLPPDLADGWLCFVAGEEKRRLAPLPPDWSERADTQLWLWCRAAAPVAARPSAPPTDEASEGAAARGGELAMA